VGEEETAALAEVIKSGVLSGFQGAWDPAFYGGPRVRAFEEEWAKYFGYKHAVAVNSACSGLYAAVGALGLEPGDEVIVSPYTMAATATAIVVYGGVPVFADIQDDIFCIDPRSILERITPRTRGIMVVHIFGHPADMDPIMAIARRHNLWVVEDCAQIPGGMYKGGYVGAIGDIGVYSLNRHKHIQTGEGGVLVTNNSNLAERLQLIRNHGEAVVEGKGVEDITNIVGFNYRMTELEAAIGLEQLRKLKGLIDARIANAKYIAHRLGEYEGLTPPAVYEGAKHVFYVQPFKFDEQVIGTNRNLFVKAMKAELPAFELQEAEGPLVYAGYVKPLYYLPMFQKQIAFGRCGYPFKSPYYEGHADYSPGICPVAERMHFKELFSHEYMRPPATASDLNDFINAFDKVYSLRQELAQSHVH
jgi:dTDP-4-amino-4,6-dideoxygalactose transaminase